MKPLDKIRDLFSKEDKEQTPEELEAFFTRNRNKPIAAKVLMPTEDEIKQKEAEEGVWL